VKKRRRRREKTKKKNKKKGEKKIGINREYFSSLPTSKINKKMKRGISIDLIAYTCTKYSTKRFSFDIACVNNNNK